MSRTFSLMVVHRHTAASISTSPCSKGQHWFAAGSPAPMCTRPPRRSTHAPILSVSTGQVGDAGGLVGGGAVTGGFPMTGGTVMGGSVIGGLPMTGGTVMGGTVMGGLPMTGGTVMGGTVIGGLPMTGGTVMGGTVIGGTVMGGIVIGGFPVEGGFGLWCCLYLGGLDLDGGQMSQETMEETEESKIMKVRRTAEVLEESIAEGLLQSVWCGRLREEEGGLYRVDGEALQGFT
nr:PREDICTED: uncharacterized protein LOC108952280 isoform X2 [Musa acuminata subsp. malaccensis]